MMLKSSADTVSPSISSMILFYSRLSANMEHQKEKVISKSKITTTKPIKFLVTLDSLDPNVMLEAAQ